jgi:hypothetical protein
VGNHVTVRVTGESSRLVRPLEAAKPHRTAVDERVYIDADAHPHTLLAHGAILP